MTSDLIKVAFGSVPKDGGTFTFYRNQRSVLLNYGIDLRCVSVGRREVSLVEPAYVDDGCVLLAEKTNHLKTQAMVFSEWCEQENIDLVMGINSEAILSALPHLSKRIRVISRCANAFEKGYQVTLMGQERLMKIIALTPRLKKDLIEKYGVDEKKITLIPNGIHPEAFSQAAHAVRGQNKTLRLGFLGRLEHNQKGVFYLPEIVKELNKEQIEYTLQIAGKGVHQKALEERLRPYNKNGNIQFLGALSADQVSEFFQNIDIYMFTSHFEGCPNALLEAMMAGCVPVSWVIDGITDFIIEDNQTGFLVKMGNCRHFAENIITLDQNRKEIQNISQQAAMTARKRFANQVAARAYADLIHQVMNSPMPDYDPKPWSAFQVHPAFRKSWKSYIPESFKIGIRSMMFHTRLSNKRSH